MPSLTLALLHRAYGGPHMTKRMARDAEVSVRTAEKWAAGVKSPRDKFFDRMAARNDRLAAAISRAMTEDARGAGHQDLRLVPSPTCGAGADPNGDAHRSATWDGAERRKVTP